MLLRLSVSNYALIEDLSVSFQPGFNIITGETGAGKSVLLGALSLILGARAELSVFRRSEKKCHVEALFRVDGYGLEPFFRENDLDYDTQVLVRREILPSGKSRAFINDTPVNLQQMRELALHLIDIHSQHQNLELGTLQFQLKIVDGVAGNSRILQSYQELYAELHRVGVELETRRTEALREKSEQDYVEFQYNQLDQAGLKPGEQEELEEEREQLSHAEEIRNALAEVALLLDGDHFPVIRQIREAMGRLDRISPFLKIAADFHERLSGTAIETGDIAREAAYLAENTEFNPQRMRELQDRLDLIYTLQQKHRVATLAELITLKEQLALKINHINASDTEIARLEKSLRELRSRLDEAALKLTSARNSVLSLIRQKVTAVLRQLGMPHAVFLVEHQPKEEFSPTGRDLIRFLFSANRNGVPDEISRIASGGEISRVMLALKSLILESSLLPTIIFDEIDAGISGETALKMGAILKVMAERMQLINITHLPQIAGMGGFHFLVTKHEGEEGTSINIRQLTDAERVGEIAKMVGGETPSENALKTARELLQRRL